MSFQDHENRKIILQANFGNCSVMEEMETIQTPLASQHTHSDHVCNCGGRCGGNCKCGHHGHHQA